MDLQYISDSTGTPKSVIIPIDDWNRLKEKYQGLNEEFKHNFYELSKEQVQAISQSFESVKRDGTKSHEQVMEATRRLSPQLFTKKYK